MDLLELRFLGSFQVSLNGQPLTAFESNKVRALLAYLAVEARQPHPRESLAGLLWPDWPQHSAMSNLRYALADLRKNLQDRQAQPPFLLVSREAIQLNKDSHFSLDVNEFDRIVSYQQSSIPDIKTAIALFRSDFLDGFSVGDSAVFEQWVVARREHYHQRMLKVLHDLAERYEQMGEYEEALVYIRQLLTLEPWQEEAHQHLMRLLAWNGQRSAALAQYEKCRQQLEIELQVEPGKETLALYERIRDGTLPAPTPQAVARPAEEPVHQVELSYPVLPPTPRHNLPRRLSRFIGREKEINHVKGLVAESPLVTLTGPGGVGKTRLALAVAEALLEDYPQGVWFVNLAPMADPQLVESTLVNVLGLPEETGKALLDRLSFYFHDRPMLLVLDNCEHLVEACAGLASTLLSIAPQLKILASSREALGVEGEVAWRVPSLSMPDAGQKPSLDSLLEYESVRLFLDRARGALPEFQITPHNAPAVAQVCQRLDGIPLAIELAAAQLTSLEVEQIAARLDNTFRLLAGGSRVALERHRTLRATIDWSHNLLPEAARLLLLRLSVFSGGCTLEAAEAVCSGDGIAQEEVLGLVSQLVNKSMLQADRQPGRQVRYRLLETIRQYASEKLYDMGVSERLRTRHLDYYLRFAEEIEAGLRGRELVRCLDRLENELGNFRSALEWGLQTDVLSELRLASALMWLWEHHDHRIEGKVWLERGLGLEEATHNTLVPGGLAIASTDLVKIRARAMSVAGYFMLNKAQAVALLEQSLALYHELGSDNHRGMALTLYILANCKLQLGDYAQGYALADQSRILYEEIGDKVYLGLCLITMANCEADPEQAKELWVKALAVEEETGDIGGITSAMAGLSYFATEEGNYEQAATYYAECRDHYLEIGDHLAAVTCLLFEGFDICYQGDHQRAVRCFEQASAILRDIGDAYNSYVGCFIYVSDSYLAQGNYAEAHRHAESALSIGREMNDRTLIARALFSLGRMDWISGGNDRAVKRLEEALEILRDIGDKRRISVNLSILGKLTLSTGNIRLTEIQLKECLRGYIEIHERILIAEPIDSLASQALLQGDMDRAARLFGAADKLCHGLVNTLSPIERTWREKDISTVRAALGESLFSERWDEGRKMPWAQAVAYALGSETDPRATSSTS